jgi:hypothetical protein
MAFPSLVKTIPPIGSRSIFNILFGPRVVLTISATAFAALIFAA